MIPRCGLRPPIVAGQGREISFLLKKYKPKINNLIPKKSKMKKSI
jgi:hypothetical protein